MTSFIKVGNSVYPTYTIEKISIFNTGSTPAKYYVSVQQFPHENRNGNYSQPAAYGIPMGFPNGDFDTYEAAQAELDRLLTEMNKEVA